MKKAIIVEVLLLFVFCVVLACAIEILIYATDAANLIKFYNSENIKVSSALNESYHTALSYGIPALFAAVADLAAMVIIAIKDFPVFKPLVDKLNAKRAARKEQRAEQAAIAKQDRIEKLQAELDELKKDE